MPGNEVVDKVHNFFEQDNLSQGQHSSQAARANWPGLANNQWAGNHSHSSTKDYLVRQSDSERVNDKRPQQTSFGTNDAQLNARSEFAKGQFTNQELSLNGFVTGHQGFQAGHNQVEFRGQDLGSNRLNIAQRGLSILERQQGNAPERSSSLGGTSERSETAETPIDFDFLGRQKQLIRSQQPGVPQPQSRQQSGLNNMQMSWQQQLMFKQLQELQRQKQLQQLNQEARQHIPMSQLPSMGKQTVSDQLPALANGSINHDASNYLCSNDDVGSDPKVLNNSQMFMLNNMNWAESGGSAPMQGIHNGLLISNEQGQVLRSMGLMPQQLDQSVYGGAQMTRARGAFNQYPHTQSISQNSADMITRTSGSHLEKPLVQSSPINKSFQGDQSTLFQDQVSMQHSASVSKEGFQGRNFFEQIPFHNMNTGVQPGSYQQLNSVPRNRDASMLEFQSGQQQAGWSANMPERATDHMGSSPGLVSLDPGEEKILFSSDDNIWDAHGVRSGVIGAGGYENPLESMDHLNSFASVQSGTWSALMQSAVAEASSSDTGLQDEWSGLSFQKNEFSSGNQNANMSDSVKQQTNWTDNNLQNASTSMPFPLFNNAKMSQSGQNTNDFQHSGNYEQIERLQKNASYESMQLSSKESSRWLDRSPQQNSLVEGNSRLPSSMHLESASQNALSRQYEQSETDSHATNMPSNALNMQGSWVHRQGMSFYNVDNLTCSTPAGRSCNESPSPSADSSMKVSGSENNLQGSQRNNLKLGMHKEKDSDGGRWKADDNHVGQSGRGDNHVNQEDSQMNNFTVTPNSSTNKAIQESNHQVLNLHHNDYGRHMVDSYPKFKGDTIFGDYQHQLGSHQVLEPSTYNSDREMDEMSDTKRDNSYNSNQSQPTATGGPSRDNFWLNSSDSRSLPSGNKKSLGQVGRKVSGGHRFQFHPMGNLEVDAEPTDAIKRVKHSQVQTQQFAQGSLNHEKEYFEHQKFVEQVPDNASDMEKELSEFQGNDKGSASFDGSAGLSSQGKRTAQTCQNMLDLFHEVDQSRDHPALSSDRVPSSSMPEAESSDASVSHQWQNQSVGSQGFGLRLAPPSQRLPVPNQAFTSQNSSQTVNDPNSRQINSRLGEKGQMWLSARSVQSMPNEVSQREHLDNDSSNSGQMVNKMPQLHMQADSTAAFMSALPDSRNQLQSQSSASGQVLSNQSVNNSNDRLGPHFRLAHDIHSGVIANQSSQASLPKTVGRTPPFNLSSPEDTSQPANTNMPYISVSGQQFPVLDSVPVSQPSAMAFRSQQGAYSTASPNVWTNVAAQQHLSGGPSQKISPNLFHARNVSNINMGRPSLTAHRLDRQDTRQGGNSSELGSSSVNSQRFAYAEEKHGKESHWQQMPPEKVGLTSRKTGASEGQESTMKHLMATNFVASGTLTSHSDQQEINRGGYRKEPLLVSQKEHLSIQNSAANRVSHQNYSLLHQVQNMKSLESDPNKRGGKRPKRADSDTDAQQVSNMSGQQSFNGYSTLVRDSTDSELNAAVRLTTLPSGDGKMLSFSSEGREEHNPNASSQIVRGEVPSQDTVAFVQIDSHNRHIHHPATSARSENTQISPQMAPSWFEQYGTFKAGQIFPMYDAHSSVKPTSQQFILGKQSESTDIRTSTEKANTVNSSQVGSVCQSTLTTLVANEHVSPLHSLRSEVMDQALVIQRPKKRKPEPLVLLPWHKEITQGSQRFRNISVAELEWAQAANRLVEKVEDEVESFEDVQPMIRPRRRLIITTQLMQQLLRSAPAVLLSADANSYYESVIYFVAKLALGEACSLMYYSESDSHSLTNENMASSKLKSSERAGDQYFSNAVEGFIGRAKKLESDLLRLDKRASILDLRVDCQDLERFSIINRFAKFHGRSQVDGAEASSSDAIANTQKTCPQRYVTGHAMPRNLPEGVQCLSL